MPTIHFHVETSLAPAVALAGITDFSARRSEPVGPQAGAQRRWDSNRGDGGAESEEQKGRLVALVLTVVGASVLRSQMDQALSRIEKP